MKLKEAEEGAKLLIEKLHPPCSYAEAKGAKLSIKKLQRPCSYADAEAVKLFSSLLIKMQSKW